MYKALALHILGTNSLHKIFPESPRLFWSANEGQLSGLVDPGEWSGNETDSNLVEPYFRYLHDASQKTES